MRRKLARVALVIVGSLALFLIGALVFWATDTTPALEVQAKTIHIGMDKARVHLALAPFRPEIDGDKLAGLKQKQKKEDMAFRHMEISPKPYPYLERDPASGKLTGHDESETWVTDDAHVYVRYDRDYRVHTVVCLSRLTRWEWLCRRCKTLWQGAE